MNLYICIFILTPFFAHVYGDEVTQNTVSVTHFIKFKEYFEKEILRLEQRYEGEIDELRQEINEKTREIRILTNQYENALREIFVLKRQFTKISHLKRCPPFAESEFEEGNAHSGKQTQFVGLKHTPDEALTEYVNQEMLSSTEDENEKNPAEVMTQKVTQKHNDLIQQSSEQTDNKRQVNVVGSSVVAFSATLTKTLPQVHQNQTIIFDDVLANVGNGYHDSHGIFTVPKPGIYVFSFTIMSLGRYAHAKLVKNGQLLVRANGEQWDESSHTIVLELKPGDIISVESNEANADYYGYKYCSFTGFLLYDYSDVIPGPVVGK